VLAIWAGFCEGLGHVVLVGWCLVTLGVAPRQADLMKGTAGFVESGVKPDSMWAVLHRECHVLFPDELFADLFESTGRRSVPPRIVATVMVLQRLFGLSDREAVQAFEFDARWKYACGGLDFDYPGFAHTVLVALLRWTQIGHDGGCGRGSPSGQTDHQGLFRAGQLAHSASRGTSERLAPP
jgi:Transposase domain (DUF772)